MSKTPQDFFGPAYEDEIIFREKSQSGDPSEVGGIVFSDGYFKLRDAYGITNFSKHAVKHQPGGSDVLEVDASPSVGSLRTIGTSSTSACAGNDSRLSDARTSAAHATTHKNGGGDEVATATINSIPKIGAAIILDIGWIPPWNHCCYDLYQKRLQT